MHIIKDCQTCSYPEHKETHHGTGYGKCKITDLLLLCAQIDCEFYSDKDIPVQYTNDPNQYHEV